MKEYIERSKIFSVWRSMPAPASVTSLSAAIHQTPAADVVERKRGEWDEIPNSYMSVATKNGSYSGHATSCSVCHEINPNAFKTNFCPNCGADMREVEHGSKRS